jgi:NADH-quinone oxidoreductase subunit C
LSSVETIPLSPPAEKLRERFDRSPLAERVAVLDLDLPTLEVSPADWPAVARFLRDDPECRFDLFLDLAGVDNAKRRGRPSRFEAVFHLLSLPRDEHVRVKVILPDGASPSLPTVSEVWPAANWFEREAFDLFGIVFSGHPDLRRILTDYGFVGHPFRKDFPLIGNVEVRYDAERKRVIYEPVSIDPRVAVPRVIRDDARYQTAIGEAAQRAEVNK